ncbi:MAG: hypothetical protein PGN27_23705 [Mycolicibacterium neoaurum]|uniref:hypothetical protein n=1 Tax=Mycolicibacterium neoaurum TaxID=1795 RepID=UPI002FFCB11C
MCDYRTTIGFELIAGGCDQSVIAARPIFEALSTNEDAYRDFSDAIHERIDSYLKLYADNDPTDPSNPFSSMLAYSGRLLGLLAVGSRQAGITPPDVETEVVNVEYVLANAILARSPSATFPPEFLQDGRVVSPADAKQNLTESEYSEYRNTLAQFLDEAANVDDVVDDAFLGQYEFAAGGGHDN